MLLGDYLQTQRAHPWADGVYDCTTFAADWACTWGRGDPMAAWRGLYASQEEAEALIAGAGGLVSLFDCGLLSIGATATAEPHEGDIGVIAAVRVDGVPVEIGAIWTGRRWAFRAHGGIAFASADCLEAWTRG